MECEIGFECVRVAYADMCAGFDAVGAVVGNARGADRVWPAERGCRGLSNRNVHTLHESSFSSHAGRAPLSSSSLFFVPLCNL